MVNEDMLLESVLFPFLDLEVEPEGSLGEEDNFPEPEDEE
jgi:hypothetical protein